MTLSDFTGFPAVTPLEYEHWNGPAARHRIAAVER
jgi:hypothetical protein